MALAYLLTPTAARDIDLIWNYIAQDNRDAADRVEAAIYEALELVGRYPEVGRKLRRKPMRLWTVSSFTNYVVIYVSEATPVQIVAVVHGSRDLRRVLRNR